uniref:Nucleophosmin n=1 Tax=Sinocyclocheilus grahami TaxID=75366 RepID=A0A672MRE1_SINGR
MEDNIKDLSRPQMYLFGCSLKADKKEHKVELDDDEAEHQLSLKALSLGGFEVTPPVSFRLQSGAGPVYISGQHFVSVKESDDEDEEEEENNTSPVKRPSNMTLAKVPQKKLKMDTDEDEDSDEDDDDDDDNDEDADKQNGSPDKKAGTSQKPQTQTPQKVKDKSAAGPSGKTPSTPNLSEVKSKLASAAKEGRSLPKTEQKFENYARSAFKISDKQVSTAAFIKHCHPLAGVFLAFTRCVNSMYYSPDKNCQHF